MKYRLLELRSYIIDENDDVYNMLQELPEVDEFEQTNEYYGLSKTEVKIKINQMTRRAYGIDCDDDNYPQSENYILFADDKPVVIGGLTIKLTDFWKMHRGSFWYKTRPCERKKGYSTQFLKMIEERAKNLGFTELIGQCNAKNIGSNKVMENNCFVRYINPLCPNRIDTNFFKKTL